jgi:hypothetical protein
MDGIYIANKDGSEANLLVAYKASWYDETMKRWNWATGTPQPEWSPNQDNVVYHRLMSDALSNSPSKYNIFVYDIVRRREILLSEQASMPIWIPRQ